MALVARGVNAGHSTFDQLGRITQTIFDGFESKKPQRAVLATLDFARAYDRVWRDGLIAKMGRMGIPCCVLRWLRALLRDRRARVRWGSSLSRERVFREGLPQGSVLAPLLWLFYINDIDTDVDNGTTCSLFADDVALLAAKSSVKACEETLQPALDSIGDWLTKWKVSPSVTKCTSTVFSLDPQDGGGRAKTKLTLQGQELPQTEHATFLGVQLDRQLTLSKHVANLKDKMARRHRCLQVLASRSYGSRKRTLRSAYVGYIRSLFDYSAALIASYAAPSTRQLVETEQNKCARTVTGCLRATPTGTLLAEAGLPPLSVRAKQLAAFEHERLSRLHQEDPARKRQEDQTTKPRLKYRAHEAWRKACDQARQNHQPEPRPGTPHHDEDAILQWKPNHRRIGQWLAREAGLADLPREPLQLHTGDPPWNPPKGVTFHLDLLEETCRADPPERRRAAAQKTLDALPRPDITVWTDGSACRGTDSGGSGCLIIQDDQETRIRIPAGAKCSSTRAEVVAISAALQEILKLPDATHRTVHVYSDSRAGLQLLSRGPSRQSLCTAQDSWKSLRELSNRGTNTTFQWVPGHVGLLGNEEADRLANQGSGESQNQVPIDLSSAKGAIRRLTKDMAHRRAKETLSCSWSSSTAWETEPAGGR